MTSPQASTTPPRRRTGLYIGIAAAVAAALLAGAAGYALAGGSPTAEAPPAAVPASASTAAHVTSPAATGTTAKDACDQLSALGRAYPGDTFKGADLPVVKTVADAAASSEVPAIATQGRFLAKYVELADLADVTKSVRELRKACAIAGYAY